MTATLFSPQTIIEDDIAAVGGLITCRGVTVCVNIFVNACSTAYKARRKYTMEANV